MKELDDASKFERLEILPDKHLNFVINFQYKIKSVLKSLHEKKDLLIWYIRKFRLLDAALVFYIAKLRYTNLSLAILHLHLLGQYLTLLTHHLIS